MDLLFPTLQTTECTTRTFYQPRTNFKRTIAASLIGRPSCGPVMKHLLLPRAGDIGLGRYVGVMAHNFSSCSVHRSCCRTLLRDSFGEDKGGYDLNRARNLALPSKCKMGGRERERGGVSVCQMAERERERERQRERDRERMRDRERQSNFFTFY
eukprot:sb/3473192/